MKFSAFVKDRLVLLLMAAASIGLFLIFMMAFDIPDELMVSLVGIFILYVIFETVYEYLRRRSFFNTAEERLKALDKKNLLPETIERADFYEGRLVQEILYAIAKSMTEQISDNRRIVEDFKEYIELWVHEVKLPLASMSLILHNHGDDFSEEKRLSALLRRMDEIIDGILFYSRSETAENDFIFKEIYLHKLIANVAQKYRIDLSEADISLSVEVGDESVISDEKWLEFCLGQIVSNAIKYKNDDGRKCEIKIGAKRDEQDANRVRLFVRDNGIGIPENDIGRIFDKSFTGENGRNDRKSTGFGLYIVKRLCDKMGHAIKADSRRDKYTEITLTFQKCNVLSQ